MNKETLNFFKGPHNKYTICIREQGDQFTNIKNGEDITKMPMDKSYRFSNLWNPFLVKLVFCGAENTIYKKYKPREPKLITETY